MNVHVLGLVAGRHPMPVHSYLVSDSESARLSIWDVARLAALRVRGYRGQVAVLLTGLGPAVESVIRARPDAATYHYDRDTSTYRTVDGRLLGSLPLYPEANHVGLWQCYWRTSQGMAGDDYVYTTQEDAVAAAQILCPGCVPACTEIVPSGGVVGTTRRGQMGTPGITQSQWAEANRPTETTEESRARRLDR